MKTVKVIHQLSDTVKTERNITGNVLFYPVADFGDTLPAESGITVPAVPVEAVVVDGQLTYEGTPGVDLFAGEDEPIYWEVRYFDVMAGSVPVNIKPFYFLSVFDGVVDLADVIPVMLAVPAGIPRGEPGPAGPAGPAGPEGPAGPAGPAGKDGERGPAGEDGTSVTISGSVPTKDDLPVSGYNPGDGLITADDGHLHVFDGASWQDVGLIRGPAGKDGERGPEGPEGPAGPAGPAGKDGERGPEGPEGPEGPAGPAGEGGGSSFDSGDILLAASNGKINQPGKAWRVPTNPGNQQAVIRRIGNVCYLGGRLEKLTTNYWQYPEVIAYIAEGFRSTYRHMTAPLFDNETGAVVGYVRLSDLETLSYDDDGYPMPQGTQKLVTVPSSIPVGQYVIGNLTWVTADSTPA